MMPLYKTVENEVLFTLASPKNALVLQECGNKRARSIDANREPVKFENRASPTDASGYADLYI